MALRSKSFRGPSLAGFIFYLRTFLLYRIEILSKIVDCERLNIFAIKGRNFKIDFGNKTIFLIPPRKILNHFWVHERKKKVQ